jgi:DNA-binding CsgD family transcriptional regulator
VAFIHGPGGIGKSVLVQAAISGLGRRVVVLDGRDVQPTASSVLETICAQLGGVEATLADLAAAAERERAVLVFDSFERLLLVDDWVRNDLVASLPATTTTIVVSRKPPNSGWRAPEWRGLLAEMLVGPMTQSDSVELVGRYGMDEAATAKVLRFGRGHPLALELAAAALARRPDLDIDEGPPPEVVEDLLDVMLDDIGDDDRAVVESASLLRKVTRPMLSAAIENDGWQGESVDRAWRMLRDLPFVTVTSAGLELNDVVRDVIASGAELRDPGRVRRLRRAVAKVVIGELERSPSWDATADLLHLVQNPIVRYAFVPPPGLQHTIEAARPSDIDEVLELADRVDAGGAAELRRWWSVHPESFRVLRDGGVRAVAVVRPLDLIDQRSVRDPLVDAIDADRRARPLWDGGRALVVRRVLSHAAGEGPCPEFAAMIVDLKRSYLEMRPSLARVYVNAVEPSELAGVVEPMGFGRLPDRAGSGLSVTQWSLDFGPHSVDGWLAMHVDLETEPSSLAATVGGHGEGQLGASSSLASLSRREREVLAALAEGLTNRELAERLFISERTANRHISNIFMKLGVRNRTEAARAAVDAGLT